MIFDFSTIQEQFQKLPEEVQYVLTSPHITEKIKEISEKNGLLLDQMEALYDVTSYVMLGLIPSDRYTTTLAKELNVSEKQAKIITDEINNEVFKEIRDSMREFEEKSKSSTFNNNPYQKTNNISQKEIKDPSIHKDLEQAGNFKIETEVDPEEVLSIKKPLENNVVKATKVDMPLVAPDISNSTIPKSQEIHQEPIKNEETKFDPKDFYNFAKNEEEIKPIEKAEERKEEVNVQKEVFEIKSDNLKENEALISQLISQPKNSLEKRESEAPIDLPTEQIEPKLTTTTKSFVPINLPTEQTIIEPKKIEEETFVQENKELEKIETNEIDKKTDDFVKNEEKIENIPTINLIKINKETEEHNKDQPISTQNENYPEKTKEEILTTKIEPEIEIEIKPQVETESKLEIKTELQKEPLREYKETENKIVINQPTAPKQPKIENMPNKPTRFDPYREPIL